MIGGGLVGPPLEAWTGGRAGWADSELTAKNPSRPHAANGAAAKGTLKRRHQMSTVRWTVGSNSAGSW